MDIISESACGIVAGGLIYSDKSTEEVELSGKSQAQSVARSAG